MINLEEIPETSPSLIISKQILQDMKLYHYAYFTNKCLSLDFKKNNKAKNQKHLEKRDLVRRLKNLAKKGNISFSKAKSPEEAKKILKRHLLELITYPVEANQVHFKRQGGHHDNLRVNGYWIYLSHQRGRFSR